LEIMRLFRPIQDVGVTVVVASTTYTSSGNFANASSSSKNGQGFTGT